MNINIKATNMELTPAISDFITKKLEGLEKFIHGDNCDTCASSEIRVFVEVGMTSKHHQTGEIYRAELQLDFPIAGGKGSARAESESGDLYAAIDEAKDLLKEELLKTKDKKESLVRRGARKIKSMFWGE